MKKLFLIFYLICFFSLSSEVWAGHNLFPCEIIYKDTEHLKATETIFNDLLYAKIDIPKKDHLATLKHIPAFEPEILYIVYRESSGYVIQRIVASTDTRDLVHVTARNNNIHTKDIPQNIDKLSDLLSPAITFTSSTKKISDKLASHVLTIFNDQMASARDFTKREEKELFSYMYGPFFIFRSRPDKCTMGTLTMQSPAKKLIDIMFILEDLFDRNNDNASEAVRKILQISSDPEDNY